MQYYKEIRERERKRERVKKLIFPSINEEDLGHDSHCPNLGELIMIAREKGYTYWLIGQLGPTSRASSPRKSHSNFMTRKNKSRAIKTDVY